MQKLKYVNFVLIVGKLTMYYKFLKIYFHFFSKIKVMSYYFSLNYVPCQLIFIDDNPPK